MKRPDYCKTPWYVEVNYGSVVICEAQGGVMLADSSNDVPEGVAEYIVHCVNTHDDLLAACELWDQGFVDGEEFTADQFLAWVNRNRAAARAAIAKARGES